MVESQKSTQLSYGGQKGYWSEDGFDQWLIYAVERGWFIGWQFLDAFVLNLLLFAIQLISFNYSLQLYLNHITKSNPKIFQTIQSQPIKTIQTSNSIKLIQRSQTNLITHLTFIPFLSSSFPHSMLKSFSSTKRPITQGSNTSQIQNHKCYFHDSYLISKFCTNKKCTLPLCQKCIPIHVKQHLKEQSIIGKQSIIPFSSAYQIATQNLNTLINSKTQHFSFIKKQLSSTRKQVQDLIKRQFAKIQQHILKGENQVKIITQKFNKIKKGSLKSLIFYFSDEEILKNKNQAIVLDDKRLAEIPLLIEKLKHSIAKFQNKSQEKAYFSIQNAFRSDSIPKTQNYPLKNYSSSFLGTSSNNFVQSITNPINSIQKPEQKVNVKFKSSSDFSLLLKEQRNRLQSVRNKNISFATKYSNENEPNTKLGSKSVDNFYFSIGAKQHEDNKEQNQSRPLQMVSKDYGNILKKGLSPKKADLNSNSQEKLSKIKQKYIGDISLSKENIRTESKKLINNENITGSKYVSKNTPIHDLKTQNQQLKSRDIDQRILSRQQIRVNIQNRLNQRSLSVMVNKQKEKLQYSKPNPIRFQAKQLFSNQINHQTLKQPFPKQKIQQFTLNKNYHQKESFRQYSTEVDRVPMSSIKRQFRAEQFDDALTQPAVKKFFDDNSKKPDSLDTRHEKNTKIHDILRTRYQDRYQDNNQIPDKKTIQNEQGRKAKIIHRQNLKNQLSKKDLLYEEAKLSIKLNDPNGKNEQAKKSRHQIRSLYQTRQNSESKRKDGRRFNYLYDAEQQVKQFQTQHN